jgi:hypothetical protein
LWAKRALDDPGTEGNDGIKLEVHNRIENRLLIRY